MVTTVVDINCVQLVDVENLDLLKNNMREILKRQEPHMYL